MLNPKGRWNQHRRRKSSHSRHRSSSVKPIVFHLFLPNRGRPYVSAAFLCLVRLAWSSCRSSQCCQARLTIRITSVASNGFASTSYAPRFKASAHKRASASREVTIRSGGSGRSEMCSNISRHVPGNRSHSQNTMGIVTSRNTEDAEASVGLAIRVHSEFVYTVQSDSWKMRSRETQSSAFGLTDRTLKCLLAAVLIPGGTTFEKPRLSPYPFEK